MKNFLLPSLLVVIPLLVLVFMPAKAVLPGVSIPDSSVADLFKKNAFFTSALNNFNKIFHKKSEVPTPPSVPTDPAASGRDFPVHTGITAAVFWIGEPIGNGSSEDNALSAWDDEWQERYGGYDDYENRNGYYPLGFIPKENPFYLDLPYNDFDDNGARKPNAHNVVPWAGEKEWGPRESMMKNRWVKITYEGNTCYGQIEDAGPYEYDDHAYVFGTDDQRPKNKRANSAGMDVSPALRDCLKFRGLNNVNNKVDWQFVDFSDVPDGPWKEIVTTSQINWP